MEKVQGLEKYKIKEITPGDGKNFPQKENIVTVHYVGTFPNTGKVFDSSREGREKNTPFKFKVGMGQVIKGWDEVILSMSIGQKIKFVCPPDCAYGKSGIKDIIPPDQPLAFEVELISVEK